MATLFFRPIFFKNTPYIDLCHVLRHNSVYTKSSKLKRQNHRIIGF